MKGTSGDATCSPTCKRTPSPATAWCRQVYAECGQRYRNDGPEHLRPVGETEWVARVARQSKTGPGAEIAGIIAHADLTLEDRLSEVLDAHEAAGEGRFCGIRHSIATATIGAATRTLLARRKLDWLPTCGFALASACSGAAGLPTTAGTSTTRRRSSSRWRAVRPDTTLVMDHFGTPVGVGRYRKQREEVYANLNASIAAVAACPNVVAKLGGLAMPDNGFPWAEEDGRASARELAEAQRSYYLNAIDCFGTDRCMFESNFPVDRISISYRSLFNAFKLMTADFSESDKQALFSGTARRIYQLPPAGDQPNRSNQ